MTTDTNVKAGQYINPSEWRVRGALRHGGIVYGPAEPLPDLTLQEALQYEAQGYLVRVLADGTVMPSTKDKRVPPDARGYFMGRDEIVLKQICEHLPSIETVHEMLLIAKASGRSTLLRFALEAMLRYGGIENPHADPIKASAKND